MSKRVQLDIGTHIGIRCLLFPQMLMQLLVHCLLKEEMCLGNFGGFKYMGVEVEVSRCKDIQLETLFDVINSTMVSWR